jgi:hypothetical protein
LLNVTVAGENTPSLLDATGVTTMLPGMEDSRLAVKKEEVATSPPFG